MDPVQALIDSANSRGRGSAGVHAKVEADSDDENATKPRKYHEPRKAQESDGSGSDSDSDRNSSDSESDDESDSGSGSDGDSSEDSDGAGDSSGRKKKSSKRSSKSKSKSKDKNKKKKKSKSKSKSKRSKVKLSELLSRISENDDEMKQQMEKNKQSLNEAVKKLDAIDFQNRVICVKSRENQRRIMHAMHPDDDAYRQHRAKPEDVAKHYRELLDAARQQKDEINRLEAFILSARKAAKKNEKQAEELKSRHLNGDKPNKKVVLDEALTIVHNVNVNGFVNSATTSCSSKLNGTESDCKYDRRTHSPSRDKHTFKPQFNPTASSVAVVSSVVEGACAAAACGPAAGGCAPAQCVPPAVHGGVTAAELHPLMEMVVQKTAEQQQTNTEKLMASQKSLADYFLKEIAAKNNRCC